MSVFGKLGVALAAIVVITVLYWLGGSPGSGRRNGDEIGPTTGTPGAIRRIDRPPPQPVEPTRVSMAPPSLAPPQPQEKIFTPPKERQKTNKLKAAPIMGYEAPDNTGRDHAMAASETANSGESGDDALGARLQATRTDAAKARRLKDRDLTITMGEIIPCTPQQPLNTQLEGFMSCIVPTDVRGTSQRVVLLARGTRIVGQLRSGLKHGQNRAFVLWTRAETPDGVIIQISSPGTDALGQNGLDVDVQTNFWSRFGGAIMLSFIDAGLQAAAVAASNLANQGGSANNISFNQFQSGGRNAAATALESTINIPPYGTRPQGEPAAIFVARDLLFDDVYAIGLRNRQ